MDKKEITQTDYIKNNARDIFYALTALGFGFQSVHDAAYRLLETENCIASNRIPVDNLDAFVKDVQGFKERLEEKLERFEAIQRKAHNLVPGTFILADED